MQAFHNDQTVKDFYIKRLEDHYDAGEIVQHPPFYWNEVGCAIGCTIHSAEHEDYETALGIPAELAYLEDVLFESMANDDAKEWPLRFLRTIPVGADLSRVSSQITTWILIAVLSMTDDRSTFLGGPRAWVVYALRMCGEEAQASTAKRIADQLELLLSQAPTTLSC